MIKIALFFLMFPSLCYAVDVRYYISKVVKSTENGAYYPEIYLKHKGAIGYVTNIKINADGTIENDWCLVKVMGDHLSLALDTACIVLPKIDYDTPYKNISDYDLKKFKSALTQFGIVDDITPISKTYGDCIRQLGKKNESSFIEDKQKIYDPEDKVMK